MLLVILWCFILANVKLVDSLNYDGNTQYRIYPRLDFTCSNSTFNFEFNILNSINNNNQQPRVLVYQDQNGKMKHFLVKLITTSKSIQRIVFSDHWNQNIEIPIDLNANQWFKFIYRRKTPIGTAEIILQQKINDIYVNIYQKDLTADLSKFGVLVYDFSNLFVGGLPPIITDKVLTVRDVKTYSKFSGKIRNLYYSSIETSLQQSQRPSAVSSTCDCEQLPKQQYALFDKFNTDADHDDDVCENDFNKNLLCSKDCNCITTTDNDYKCECLSANCGSDKAFKSYQINFNDDKFSSNEIIYSLLSSLSSLMSVKLSDVKWNANNGLEFRTANSFVSFKQSSNIKDVDSCFWNIDKCSNGFTQFIDLRINRLESTKLNEKIVLFQNGQSDKQSTLTCYLYKNRIYFSLFDSIDNKEWLVNAQIGDYLKQNINDFSIILSWDNIKPSFTLHINGLLADYVINPLIKQINGDLLIQSQNYIYQFGLIGEKLKQQQITHQYQIRSVRRDYYENSLTLRNEIEENDELYQFDGISRPSSIIYSNNARFVSDDEIPKERKVLFLDGKKNFAKVSLNNFFQDPTRLISGFTLIARIKISRLNVDNMYFMYGNGLEIFTLNKEMIVKYQTDDKEWRANVNNLIENKWYTFNITWDSEKGLKVYSENLLIASDSKPSLIDIIDYLTTDLLFGQPPANSLANYGEFLLDYLVILPTSRQSNIKSDQPLDARVIESAPYPDIIRIDNNINRVVYKIDSPLTAVTSESIELAFQTTEPNGVVFYIHNNPVISYFEILNGQPIFVIETQYQVIQLRPYISYRLDDGAWHTIKFQRNGQRVILQLDKSNDESAMSHSNAILTGSSVYLGLADPNNIRLSNKKPFVGHMSRAKVVINNVQQNVRQQPYIKYDTSVSSIQSNPTNINIDTSQLSNLDGKTINIILNFYGPPGSKPGTNLIQTDVETHVIYLDSLPDTRYISLASQDREVEFYTGSVVLDVFSIKFQTRKSNGQLCVLHIDDKTYIGLEVYDGLPYATYSYSNRKERVKLSDKRVDDGKIYQAYVKQDPNQVTCWLEHDDTYKTTLIYGSGLNINSVLVGGDGNRYDFKSGSFVGCIGSIILNQRDVIDYKFVQSERRQKCENLINTPVYIPVTVPTPIVVTPSPTIDISFGYISFLEPEDLYYFNYVYDSEKPTFNDISFIFQTLASDGILFSAYELVNNHINNLIGAYLQSGRVHVVFANITTTIDIPFNDLSNVNNGYIHRLYVRRHITGEIQAFLQSYTISQTIEFSTQPITIRISRLIVGGTDEAPRVKIFGTLPNFVGCILDSFQLNGINLFIPTQIPKLRYECPVRPIEPLVTYPPVTRPTIRITTTPVPQTEAPSSCYSSCNTNDCLIELRDGYFVYEVQNRYSRERDYIRFTFRIDTPGIYNLLTIPYPDRSITIYVSNGRLMVNTLYRNVLDTYPVGTEKYDDARWHEVSLEKQYQELIVTVDGFSQFVNIGIDFDLYGDGRLYFGASNSDNRNYLNGELRAIYAKFGTEQYDILASVKDKRIPGAFCHGTVIVRPYIVQLPAKPGFKCDASPSSNGNTECHTDGACFAALWRNASGEVERHMRCFNKDQLQPIENPLLCRYQEDVRFVIKCCYSDHCNRDLDLKLTEISKNNERSVWKFKGPTPGSLQYFTQSQGVIESQLTFEFNTTQSEGPLLLTRDDNQLLKLDLKGSKLQLSLIDVNNRRPTKVIECISSRPLLFNDNKWHKVQLVKKNRIVTLSCDDGQLQQLQSDTEIPFVNTKYGVKLGSQSLDPKVKSYIGELSQIVYIENNIQYTFDDLQYSEDKRYTYDGYVEFLPKFIIQVAADPKPIKFRSSTSSAKLFKWDKEKSSGISFDFKTSNANQNGLILSTQKNGQYFAVVLVDGYIEVVLSPHTLLPIDKSNPSIDRYQRMFPFPHSKVNDGRWHKFQLSVDSYSIGSIVLDENESSKFRIYKLDYWTEESDLVFGRNPDINSQINSDLDRSFIGCLKNVVIGNKIIDWSITGSLYNVEAGCYNDIYRDNYLPFFQTSINSAESTSIASFANCLRYNPSYRNSDKEKVEFMFKTSDDKSALFNSIGSDVNIYTQGPAVVIRTNGMTNKLLVERGIAFNDGNWHKLRIEKNDLDILVSIDEKYAQVVKQNRRIQLGPFYVGCLRGKSNGEARDLKGEVASLVYSSTDQTELDLIDGLSKLNQNVLIDDNLKWVPSKEVVPIDSKYTAVTLKNSSSYIYLDRADFDKSPNSRILFSFKTNENNGLLAFIGQNSTLSDKSNFLAVELVEGIPNLVVNLANQLKRVECSIDKLNDNKWHSVEIRRDRLGDAGNNNGASSTITFRCDNRFHRFEALEESVLGQLVMGNSITAFSRLPSQLWLSRSPKYLGCIKDLVINDRYVDIYDQTSENSRNTLNIGCSEASYSCRSSSKCQNSGSCVEGFSESYCNCDATSFTGKICETAAKTSLFNGSYGVEYYSENKLYTSSSEEIFLRFRTRLRHGVLIGLKKSNDNAGLVIGVEDGRVKVVYQCGRNDKAVYVGDINAYNTNKWNSIRLKRYGQKLILEVIDGDKGQKTIVDDLGKNCAQFDYNTIVVGSIFSQRLVAEYPNFIGFIQNLQINNEEIFGDYISKISADNNRISKWSITGNAEVGESILLLHHQVSFKNTGCPITLAEVYSNEKFSLHLLFKTSQPKGVVFFRRGRDLFPYMILELVEGTLKFSFDLGTGLTVIKCDKIYNLNDKTWHRVSIKRIGNQFVLQVDNSNELAADILPNSRPLIELESLVVGGIPDKYHYLLKDVIINPVDYMGCLASFEINGEVPDLLHEARHMCPNLQYGCLDLTCSPNPCYNNGQCSVATNQLGCNCELTSYTGSFCQDDSKFFHFGGKEKYCGVIRYKVVPAFVNSEADKFAFGFYTSQKDAVLAKIESDKGDQFFEIKLVDGIPQICARFENKIESWIYSVDRKFNDNHYHVVQVIRDRSKFLFKIDNFAQEEFCLEYGDGIFRSQSIIYAGSIYDSTNILSNCFYGYMSGMVFNNIRILDLGSIIGDVIVAVKPADTSVVNITVQLLEDGSCPLGYRRDGKMCFFFGCPKASEFLPGHMCRCISGYIRILDECFLVPELEAPVKIIQPSTKLILAPAVGVAETPIGLILGILSGIGLAILGAAIAARKCADGACIPRRGYVSVPVHLTPSTAVAQVVTGTVSNATDTLIRREVPIERRDLLTEEVINTQHEDIYHEKAGQAVDVLDFGYLQAPIVTQSVNETMEMYEQSTAHAGTSGVHHQSSHRDLAMDSLFYSQNATDYELSNVTCVTMTPNGKYAIIGQSLGSPQIWDTTNGQLIRSMNGACSNCSNLTLACNGTLLAGLASDANGALDGHALNLQLWEVQTGRPIQLTHQIKCCVFALSSDSNSIFMAGNQRFGRGISVGILDLVSNELVKEIKSDPNISFGDFPESVVITPDAKHAVVACKSISGTNFVVFDLAKTTEIAQTRSIALDAEPKCIQVLNNNEVLTGTRGGHIVQWNIHSCKPTVTFVDPNENRAHNANVHQILLSPDKEYLASGSSDGTAKVWNTNTKQLVSIMNGHQGEVTCIAMSHNPNNDLLITGSSDQTVCLWRLYTGHQVSLMSVGMNLVEVYMAKHNKTIVAIGEKDGEQQLLLLKVINVQK